MYQKLEDFISDWTIESESTLKIFNNLTDESLTKKVDENVRNAGRLAWHITTAIGEMASRVGLNFKADDPYSPVPATAKEIVDAYKEASENLVNFIKSNWNDDTLLVEDDTVEQLAGLLGAELGDIENYVREMRFSDDKSKGVDTLSVFYKDMRFVGRAKDVDASKLMEFDQYFDSYARTDQDVRLGMTYLKPGSKGETLDGINVFVTYDGTMMPYGGVPDIKSNIYFESYQQFQARVLKDVVSRTLLFKGLDTVRRIAEEVDPQIMDRIRRKNWIASVADESLDTPEKRLYVTVRLLQKELEAGEIAIDDLPEYVREMVGISPEDLQEQYKAHISSQLQSEHTYGNELVTIFLPNEKK